MIRKEVSIQNAEGLQSKPAALLVQTACRYTSRILIEQGPKTINAKSMMGVLSLGVGPGDAILLRIDGEDEQSAMEAMSALIASGFKAQ
ncbi:HPr family phosphocarrier protein [Beduinella massiliensis]|uniref:HPr family phosphocarrier protein n=1 Tax=Beduinella massiliensis TaxID=1852363 RepID=UPI000C83BA0B